MDLKVLTILAVVMTIVISDHETYARPAYEDAWQRLHKSLGIDIMSQRHNACEHSSTVRELCQRCAKVTKAKLAYPMCCESIHDTRQWCSDILNFGRGSNTLEVHY